MPFTYRIDKERRLVISTASGVLTEEDVRTHQQTLKAEPDFSPGFDQLADFTLVSKVEMPSSVIRAEARSNVFSPESKLAGVATGDEAFGLLRMYVAHRELAGAEEQMRIFRSTDEAVAWLGVDAPCQTSRI